MIWAFIILLSYALVGFFLAFVLSVVEYLPEKYKVKIIPRFVYNGLGLPPPILAGIVWPFFLPMISLLFLWSVIDGLAKRISQRLANTFDKF